MRIEIRIGENQGIFALKEDVSKQMSKCLTTISSVVKNYYIISMLL